MKEAYFVLSETDEPVSIYFDKVLALASEFEYIDSFDLNGHKVTSYKFEDGKYTEYF